MTKARLLGRGGLVARIADLLLDVLFKFALGLGVPVEHFESNLHKCQYE